MKRSELIELLQHPAENLSVEIKQWLDPDNAIDAAKIAKALMALRNFDGGVFILGLDNKTFQPVEDKRPSDLQQVYHSDRIQAVVGKHSRPAFEVDVNFIPMGGLEFPVIVVPGGITAPVMSRSTVRETNGRIVLEQNAIYTRCLANDLVSSCKPVTHTDWDNLMARCFANREVNVGQFIQRHIPKLVEYLPRLSALENTESPSGQSVTDAAAPVSVPPRIELRNRDPKLISELLEYGRKRFETRLTELQSTGKLPNLPPHGSWEVACIIEGCELKFGASDKFLNELFVHQPGYTGWPMWRDTRASQNEVFWPYPFERGWESIVVRLNQSFFFNHINFWRIEPRGRFYEYRALEDDVAAARGNQQIPPLKVLDFLLVIARVTEAIAVCLHYAKGLGCPPSSTLLKFGFRWTKLRGRELASWAEPLRTLMPSSEAIQDEIATLIEVPLNIETAQVPHYTKKATEELFEIFGKEFATPVFEEIGDKTLRRN
jgi:hypothetical protein